MGVVSTFAPAFNETFPWEELPGRQGSLRKVENSKDRRGGGGREKRRSSLTELHINKAVQVQGKTTRQGRQV
jgi:hypothetical protein